MLLVRSHAPKSVSPRAVNANIVGRRVFDIMFAGASLFCMAVPMALITAAICLDDGLPIFFAQTRVGERGRHFRLYKFRKFHANDLGCGAVVTLRDDARLTRVGKILVKTKLDELPQLWNVLKGEMSIVGPRPEMLHFSHCYGDLFTNVLRHRPGIFGPNQVFFRDESALYDATCDPEQFYRDVLFPLKARIDLAYFPRRTLVHDVAWIARGVFAVFGWSSLPREGADGIEAAKYWVWRRSRRNGDDPARPS